MTDSLTSGGGPPRAQLDDLHNGDITGAFGTIAADDVATRRGFRAHLRTFLAILGPGLIVMVGDNDAGAFSTYTQAGQNYGTALLWTLPLLIPVLYVNQEMVLRLGIVTGVGHARLIFERFGKFWGWFSLCDVIILNALTIVTEFIGIMLGLDFLHVPQGPGIAFAAGAIMLAVSMGSLRRFERFAMALCAGSLALVPVCIAVHPPLGQSLHDLVVPHFPTAGKPADIMMLIIAIIGTTIAPWQLFFQQSYVIDKRITPRFLGYERLDVAIGIGVVILGAFAMIACAAATFAGHAEAGRFTDAGGVATGIAQYVGRVPAIFFAIALIDAGIIGAAAISLSTAYAIGDVFTLKHSLHRSATHSPVFFGVYAAIVGFAVAVVLYPHAPLGLITLAVQTLAGILLPGATVFLVILANDRALLGPWVNGRKANALASVVVALLVVFSALLTAVLFYPQAATKELPMLVGGACAVIAALGAIYAFFPTSKTRPTERAARDSWRIPLLASLPPLAMNRPTVLALGTLRAYLIGAVGLFVVHVLIGMHA